MSTSKFAGLEGVVSEQADRRGQTSPAIKRGRSQLVQRLIAGVGSLAARLLLRRTMQRPMSLRRDHRRLRREQRR